MPDLIKILINIDLKHLEKNTDRPNVKLNNRNNISRNGVNVISSQPNRPPDNLWSKG
jgi:hypothetical protein